jgi:rhodanese-related sulfurtransferase
VSNASAVPMEVSCRAVKEKLDAGQDFLFVDCREQNEYDLVKIAGARLVPMSQLAARVSELETHRELPLVIHCHHGGRSLQVAAWLRQRGFDQAQSMAGGIDRWAQEIEPGMTRY